MNSFNAYVPADRCCALARGESLPERAMGTALFADISGFTPLTDAFARALGPRAGAEALAGLLNQFYERLIAAVQGYGGSVVSFAGDAITCWFVDPAGVCHPAGSAPAAWRAAASALAMQQAVANLAEVCLPNNQPVKLSIKISLASGQVRRWVIGDPQRQLLDVLAGHALLRLAEAQRWAASGQVVADRATLLHLGGGGGAGEPFAVLEGMDDPPAPATPPAPLPPVPAETLRPWLWPPIYERLQAGLGDLAAELRPAVAMFLCFEGLDYENDEEAGARLDAYLRWVQDVLTRYGGNLCQLNLDDKGSNICAAFGAPTAYEDDARRAVLAALELRLPPPSLAFIRSTRIGISRGTMFSGAYGSAARRTYGVLGSETNLAARLMQAAAEGQILATQRVRDATGAAFRWQRLPAIQVKGKSEPVPILAPLGVTRRPALDLVSAGDHLPLVGRQAEMACIRDRLERVRAGQGQILGLCGEAGVGKSRLVAQLAELAGAQGLAGYAGEGQSYGTNMPYLAWRSIWRGLFGLDAARPAAAQIAALEQELERIDPDLVTRTPLLGRVLELPIPDNALTASFNARLRKESLEALLVDCLRARAVRAVPLLLVLEDAHWLDPLSADLLEALSRVVAGLPVLLVLAYRPPRADPWPCHDVMALAHATELCLPELTPAESEQLIAQALKARPGRDAGPPLAAADLEQVVRRTQGNPFFIIELLRFWQSEDPDRAPGGGLDLPDSLHTLVLARLDQLSERERMTIKVASVVGRVFAVAWLRGTYPALGSAQQVQADLERMQQLEIAIPDPEQPQQACQFKHVVLQEVAYESMPAATRAGLHGQLAAYLEGQSGQLPPLDLLAYHYERSENRAKKLEYLSRAAEAAQAGYAHAAAAGYWRRLLALLDDRPAERIDVLLALAGVVELLGAWAETEQLCRQALALAEALADGARVARCQLALGRLDQQRGDYGAALEWLERARADYRRLGQQRGLHHVLAEIGGVYHRQGDYPAAAAVMAESLALASALDDRLCMARVLKGMGNSAWRQGQYDRARSLYQEGLILCREVGDKQGEGLLLNNLGNVADDVGQSAAALALYEDSLALMREIGDRPGMALVMNNLAFVAYVQGNLDAARELNEESLRIKQALGDQWGIASSYNNLGSLALEQADLEGAEHFFREGLALAQAIGVQPDIAQALCNLGEVAAARGDPAAAAALYRQSLILAREGTMTHLVAYNLVLLADAAVALLAPDPEARRQQARRAVRLLTVGDAALRALRTEPNRIEARVCERARLAVESALDADELAVVRQQSTALSLDQVIDQVLEEKMADQSAGHLHAPGSSLSTADSDWTLNTPVL